MATLTSFLLNDPSRVLPANASILGFAMRYVYRVETAAIKSLERSGQRSRPQRQSSEPTLSAPGAGGLSGLQPWKQHGGTMPGTRLALIPWIILLNLGS